MSSWFPGMNVEQMRLTTVGQYVEMIDFVERSSKAVTR